MNASGDRPRVSLCCEPGLYLRDSICYLEDTTPSEPVVLPEIHRSDLSISRMRPEDFVPQYGVIRCFVNAVYQLQTDVTESAMIYLLENGTIYVNRSITGDESFDVDHYCLAPRITDNGSESVVSVCLQPHRVIELRSFIVYAIMSILSIPFVVAIFVIHALLREMRNVQGHAFRSYLAALLVMFVTIAEVNLDPHCLPVMSNWLRLSIEIVARVSIIIVPLILPVYTFQWSLLANFFWMNVMGFDIWWTFG